MLYEYSFMNTCLCPGIIYCMKTKYKAPGQRQLHKKRALTGIFIVAVIIISLAGKSKAELLQIYMAFMMPGVYYETYYGDREYAFNTSYDAPEWFYEDEDETLNTEPAASDCNVYDEEGSNNNSCNNDKPCDNGDRGSKDVNDDNKNIVDAIANKSVGTTYSREKLADPDFLKSRIFTVDGNTYMNEEETRIDNLLNIDLKINDEVKGPKVLIYHTHASESFADSRPGVKEDTVVGVGDYLTKLLNEKYNIQTIHDETAYDIIDGQLDRSKAYEKAYDGITKILADNPTIEVVIDLHRDGVNEDTHLVTEVDGRPTAKIMFLNGVSRSSMNGEIDYLKNPNKLTNLAFSLSMFLTGKEYYGDFVRKIYVRSLRYNLHVMPKSLLIEAGAQNNTLEEEKNAMEPLADMLDKVLRK